MQIAKCKMKSAKCEDENGKGLRGKAQGLRLEAMCINMFEVEGWRLKAKVKENFCLKPHVERSSHL
jgi:hypothetical protein